jgi:glycerate 2-kinase
MNLIFSDMKQKALQIFLAGVDNVLPNKLVNKVFSRKDFQLDKFNNIYLLAFGKASFLMAKEAENILGERIVDGVVITTYGNGGKLDKLKVIIYSFCIFNLLRSYNIKMHNHAILFSYIGVPDCYLHNKLN